MTDPKGTWSDGGKVWNGEPMQGATICPHCRATVLSTSQPERMGDTPVGATHMRRPEYVAAWLFDGVAMMPLWLIERYHSLPLPEHRKGCYALAVDGEFWRWMDVARFEEMFMPAALAATPAVGVETIVNCVRFVKWALQEGPWSGGDLDGGGIQDKAESLGLIIPVPYDPEKHGAYNDYGCDAGDPWFEFSPGLNAAAQPASPLRASHSGDLLDTLMEVYADAVNNGDGYLGKAQLEYTLMKHDLCLIDARDREPPASPLRGREVLKRCDELHDLGFNAGWNGAIEECAKHIEGTALRNPTNIARDIRALVSASPPEQPAAARKETEIELLAYRLAGAELDYRIAYEKCGGDSIDTGRAWDKMRLAGDAIRKYEPPDQDSSALMPPRTET